MLGSVSPKGAEESFAYDVFLSHNPKDKPLWSGNTESCLHFL